jgi:hypothetical protein
MLFNHDKTEVLVFGKPSHSHPLFLNNKPLKFVNIFKHLGHILSFDLSDIIDIERCRSAFTSRYHMFLSRFSSLSPPLKTRLFSPFCNSFYGSSLWDFSSSKTLNCFAGASKQHRKVSLLKSHIYAIRRTWNLPSRSIIDISYRVSGQPPLICTLRYLQLGFLVKQVILSTNPIIALCWKLSYDHNLFLFRSCSESFKSAKIPLTHLDPDSSAPFLALCKKHIITQFWETMSADHIARAERAKNIMVEIKKHRAGPNVSYVELRKAFHDACANYSSDYI